MQIDACSANASSPTRCPMDFFLFLLHPARLSNSSFSSSSSSSSLFISLRTSPVRVTTASLALGLLLFFPLLITAWFLPFCFLSPISLPYCPWYFPFHLRFSDIYSILWISIYYLINFSDLICPSHLIIIIHLSPHCSNTLTNLPTSTPLLILDHSTLLLSRKEQSPILQKSKSLLHFNLPESCDRVEAPGTKGILHQRLSSWLTSREIVHGKMFDAQVDGPMSTVSSLSGEC